MYVKVVENKDRSYIPIKQWTKSWRLTLKKSSKAEKVGWLMAFWTCTASGTIPLKFLERHAPVVIFHTPCLNGPVWTQKPVPFPFPPRPFEDACHKDGSFELQGLCDQRLQSQYGTVTRQSASRSKFSNSQIYLDIEAKWTENLEHVWQSPE